MGMYVERFKQQQPDIALFGGLHLTDLIDLRIKNCKRRCSQAGLPLWDNKPEELLRGFMSPELLTAPF